MELRLTRTGNSGLGGDRFCQAGSESLLMPFDLVLTIPPEQGRVYRHGIHEYVQRAPGLLTAVGPTVDTRSTVTFDNPYPKTRPDASSEQTARVVSFAITISSST